MAELPSNFLSIEIVWLDYDMLELAVQFVSHGWSAQMHAYAARVNFPVHIDVLRKFAESLSGDVCVDFGLGTPHGQVAIRGRPHGSGGQIVFDIRLEDEQQAGWSISASLLTEPELLNRFVRQLSQMARTLEGLAVLEGLV